MSLSETSIRRPVLAWMIMLGLLVFGAICFSRMGISQMPDVDFPVVNIALQMDNAAPEVMEMDVVDIIEDSIMGIEGLKNVTSSSSQGVANITCEFDFNRNIDVAVQQVQTRISQAAKQLPTQLYPPVITKTNPEDKPILWVMVTADEKVPRARQMMYARNTLKDQLSTVSGVGNIVLGGYVDTNLRVWLDSQKLHQFELTANDVMSAIQAEQIEQPAGRIESTQKEYNIRVLGEAVSPQEFGKIRINSRAGGPNYKPIQISDVARVEENVADERALSRYNGQAAVGLGIVKQHGSNAVEVAKLTYEKVEKMRPSLLPGFHMDVRLDTTRFIQESVSELNFTLVLSALLTSLVCFLFLGSWSSTFNVLLAIPTSIVGSFIVLYFFGFTLNTFTLLGLSLAIGIVVDDSIMMLENIVRHFDMGKTKVRAALDGADEISFAALAATVAIAAIFIPVVFMKGIVGKFFFQYGITVTVAVLLSLLEALTLTPMRCSRYMTSAREQAKGIHKWMNELMNALASSYQRALKITLDYRKSVVAFSTLFFIGSTLLLIPIRKELVPPQDQSLFLLNIQTPVGTSLGDTDLAFKKAEDYLKTKNFVKEYYTTIGNYNGNDIVNAGNIYVTLTAVKDRKLTQRQIMDLTRKELIQILPKAILFTQDLSLTGFSASRGYPVEFTVEGPDWDKLVSYSKEIMKQVEATGLITDVSTEYQDGMPQIQIIPDRDRAAAHGVAVSSIGQEISTLIGGQKFSANTQYPKDGHRYDIRVRSETSGHESPRNIEDIRLWNNRGVGGEMVHLADAAQIKMTHALQIISRLNRARAIPVYANVAFGKSQQDALQALEAIGSKVLPGGYHLRITGGAQSFKDSFMNLIFALILGIAVSYMVLASQFNSFVHPFTVLVALPFSLSGALVGLFIFNQSLNLFSMIGLILLMGIVKKNSILLVDFTNQRRRDDGLSGHDALLEACPIRLRPILMTSIACVAGAIPAALALGPGAETRIPMAICIIGGVFVSTFLTLFVVPCVYSLMLHLEKPELADVE
jgi:hydrophobe/amphiphile efflux-1 (HAE1) family protein